MDKVSQLLSKAETYYVYFTRDANAEARRLLRRAIEIDPKCALAHAELAYAQMTAWLYNWDEKITDLDEALKLAKAAVRLDDNYYNLWVLADVQLYRREFDAADKTYGMVREKAASQAIPEEQRAVHVDWADMLLMTGRTKQAIELARQAIAESPVPERWFYWVLGWALYVDGQYKEALSAMRKLGNPRNAMRKNVIACLMALGRTEEAKRQARKFLREENKLGTTYALTGQSVWRGLEALEDRVPFQDDKQQALWKGRLEKAFRGLKAP